MDSHIEDIHDFWFGPLDESGMCREDRKALWFSYSEITDQEIRGRFKPLVQRALTTGLAHWADCDKGLIALILLLDQFTRNIYRDTARAFSGDTRALNLAQHSIASGHYQRLPAIHQVFLYLPLEHCEDREVQEECVTLFEELATITGNEKILDFSCYAVAHRKVIDRFGRFPHRNALLGRKSTLEELAYLDRHGGF